MKVKVLFVSKKNMKGDESMKIKSLLGGVCVVAISLVLPCRADYTCVTNGFAFNYTVNADGKAIIQYNNGALFKGEELFIPAQLDGRPVISLGHDAFIIVTNSFYETKRGRAFVENGPQEIGGGAFYTDGSGWDVVCVPGSVTRFSGSFCFRTVGKVCWTISSETLNIDQFAFSIAPYAIRIVATCGVPNELHDKCYLWDCFGYYGSGYSGQTYYKCKKEHFEEWVARGGLDRFRGYVDDDYVYGEQSLVSFSVEGGEPVPDRTYRQGSPYQSFPTPTKIGYSFLSWRTIPYPEAGQNDGFVVDVDDVVTSPRETLYAEWSPLKPTWTVENTSATYDGNAHDITVRPIAPVDGVAVTYAETEAGPYTEVSPTLTEAGTKQIWYVLKAPDWTPLTNSATLKVVKLVSDTTVTKTLTSVSYVYSGTAKRPSVVLKDTTALPNLAVTAYSAGDVDGDGQLTENDITLIQRYNAYQKLSVKDKEKFPSYNLTGSALVAADVNKDGVVDANDVTALRAKFSGYELVEGTDYTVAYSDNVNAGTGRVTIIGKGNYGGSTVLEFTISKATLGESGEPGSGSQPSDGKSKYDVTCVYDGQGHTVNTNALSSLKINAATMEVAYSLDGAAGWGLEPPVYTNAGQYVIWYRLRNPNYNDYVHEVQLTITPKPISDSSITKTLTPDAFVYDGTGKMPKETIVDESVFRWQFVAPYAHGDVDGDGVLTQEDVNAIDRYLSYLEMNDDLKSFFEEYALTGVALVAADYNGDGVVDEADMTELEASFVTLQKGVDYAITYKNNVNPGTATAIVSGLGNYGGTTTLTFTIVSLEIAIDDGTGGAGGKDSRFSYSGMYDGQGHGISVEVTSVAEPHVQYALEQEGPYSDNLLLTNACTETAVWYTVFAAGYNTYTNWATVTISPRTVMLTSGSARKVYDGTPLVAHEVAVGGDGFAVGEGATFDVTGAQTDVGTSANTFAYSLNDGTKAGNYTITTAYGTLTVTKATVGPGGEDEPGGGELPAGGTSKFDTAAMYDGAGHTIDTNALVAAFGAAMVGAGETRFFYGSAAAGAAATGQGEDAGMGAAEAVDWREVAPAFTNAGEYAVWYKVVNPNYEDFVHRAKVTITSRSVTLTSGSARKVYDGTPLTEGTVAVGGDGFADGEGATFDVTGSQMTVGTSANTFAYSLNDGTKAGNYEIATAYGALEVTKATVGPGGGDEPGSGELPAGGASKFDAAALYDGEGHTIDTNALVAAFGVAMVGTGETRFFYGSAAAGAAATGQGMGVGTGIDTEQGEGVGLGAGAAEVAATEQGLGAGAEAVADWQEVAPVFTNAGEYAVWYKVVNPNYEDFVHRAKVTISPRAVTLTSGSARKVYDGTPLVAHKVAVGGDGFADGEGATYAFTGAQTTVGASENTFAYSLNDGTKAGNYEIATAYGTLEVTKATVGPGGGDEPGSGELPAGGISKFDAAALYDGEGHTIDTNALTAAFGAAMVGAGETRFFYGRAAAGAAATGQGQGAGTGTDTEQGEGAGRSADAGAEAVADWQEVSPAFTNVGEHVVWYRVVNPNYEDFVHRAKVTITPRAVTLTSGSASKVYDGTALVAHEVAVGGDGFADGEGATYAFTGAQTDVGTCENMFAYSLNDGTKAGNYAITTAHGTLEVTKATVGPGGGDEPGSGELPVGGASKFDAAALYDGAGHTIDTNALVAAFGAAMAGAGETRFFYGSAAAGAAATEQGEDVGTGAEEIDTTGQGQGAGTGAAEIDWQEVAPVFTNAGEYAVWYKVANPNYEDFVHRAKVTITPRAVTVKSRSRTKPYDGTPLRLTSEDIDVSLTDGGTESALPAGEAFAYGDFAERTAAGEVAATFTVSAGVGTQLANYALTVVYGTLTVAKATYPGQEPGGAGIAWSVAADAATWVYDGRPHGVALTGVPAGVTAHLSGNTATDAGDYVATATLDYDAANYEPPVAPAPLRWSIVPRPVTLVSAGAEKVYDGTPLRADAVRVKEGSLGFVGDEGFTAACRGALTDVGAMENLFDYALAGGALAGNYAIAKEYGWLRVTPAALDPGAVFGGGETDAEGRLVCTRVYNGAPQPFALAPDFGEPYRVFYALVAGDESAYSGTAPTRTHVAEGDLAVFFKFMSPNYAPYYGTGVLRIAPKALTDEMVVADEDAAWFFDGTEKKPSVTVVDGSPNVATADDWTVAYSDRTGAGLFPVTVTGRNDYCGTVTKEFAILKRPVAPPAIPSTAYSGRLQRPGVPADSRWTVVANPGGTDAGDYTNVVLRLTAPADYRWKGLGEDETDWTGVFTIRRGANGWSVYPLIRSWTNGVDAAGEPLGRPRFGTLSVAYRRRGAPVETESPLRPSAPGRYTARFWAEETANYAGVALVTPYEVDFEIFPGPGDPPAGDATATTPVPVPHAWLDAYVARFGAGDYEVAANAVGANGVALWASYVAGLDPADAASRFTAAITVGADGVPRVTWTPDLSGAEPPRVYTVYGKAGLGDADWTPVTDANRARMRFFRVQVELK